MTRENQSLEPIKMGSTGLDQLSKNLNETKASFDEEDIGEQLLKNWKNIVTAVVLAVVIGLGINALREGQARSAGAASERFEAVQRDFDEILLKDDKASDSEHEVNTQRAFDDNLKAIKDLDSRSIYASFGELYRAAKELALGNAQAALEILKPFELSQLNGKLDAENLLVEQALLLKAKALLASANEADAGRGLLKELATSSRVVSGEALISYLRLSGPDQKLVDAVFAKNPGLRDVLKSDLETFGLFEQR